MRLLFTPPLPCIPQSVDIADIVRACRALAFVHCGYESYIQSKEACLLQIELQFQQLAQLTAFKVGLNTVGDHVRECENL